MSHKVKTPIKEVGATLTAFNELPQDVLKVGYLKKLKKMKRKFFVLRKSNGECPSQLEYYTSEKKWRSGCDPKKIIILKSCFNISRKLHPKHKCIICLYTQEECFSIAMETEEELDEWLSMMLELQLNEVDSDETKSKLIYEHVWQVVVDDRELEFSKDISGPYCLGLTTKSLSLIKMSSTPENLKVLEFPLMSIRRCGHSGKHFFIELGRSAVTGAGGIWMETEGTVVAQNMHETILSAMKSSRNKNELGSRPRSASTSENTKPITTRRPVGVVLPQPLPLTTALSNSRERCDTMCHVPCRPYSISENDSSYSVHVPNVRENSRPHSFYAWPMNSPTLNNLSYNSNTLSTSLSSSLINDTMDENTPPYHLSQSLHPLSTNSNFHSSSDVPQRPDPYLVMSPTDGNKNIVSKKTDYLNMSPVTPSEEPDFSDLFQCSPSNSCPLDYMDMNSSQNIYETTEIKKQSNSLCLNHKKVPTKEGGYMSMAPCGASEDLPIPIQEGYLSMSPISSVLQDSLDENTNDVSEFKLDKVQSLVKQQEDEPDFIKPVRAYSIGSRSQILESRTRAYSVGNENTICKASEPDDQNATDATKSTSDPILQDSVPMNKSKQDLTKGCDLMEIDYRKSSELTLENSNPKLLHKHKLSSITNHVTSLNKVEENSCWEPKNNLPMSQSDSRLTHISQPSKYTETRVNHVINCDNSKGASRYPLPSPLFVKLNDESPRSAEERQKYQEEHLYPVTLNTIIPKQLTKNQPKQLLKSPSEEKIKIPGEYINLVLDKPRSSVPSSTKVTTSVSPLTVTLTGEPDYMNLKLGKPYTPLPNPALVSSTNSQLCAAESMSSTTVDFHLKTDVIRTSRPSCPFSLPTIRKQMSAPAVPPSLQQESVSPGRKSSCPVTATDTKSSSLTSTNSCKLMIVLPSIESNKKAIADNVNSNTSTSSEAIFETQYENINLPSSNSRPSSDSSDRELNYASLDLAPSSDLPQSPRSHKISHQQAFDKSEPLTYAEIDFTKSEGLRHTSGTLRDSRF